MKKLFLLGLAVVFAMSLNAQKIGAKVGYTMSGYTLNFDKPDGSKMGMGFNAGIVGQMGFGDLLAVRVDLGYNQLGSDFYLDENDVITDTKDDASYLTFGAAAKIGIGPGYFFAGPYFGYAMKFVGNGEQTVAGETTVYDEVDYFKDADGNDYDFYNKTDFGLYGGFGASFAGVFAELGFGYGLMNFMNKDNDDYKLFPETVTGIEEMIDYYESLGVDAGTVGDYWPFMDGNTAVTEPIQKNLYFTLSVGYMFGK